MIQKSYNSSTKKVIRIKNPILVEYPKNCKTPDRLERTALYKFVYVKSGEVDAVLKEQTVCLQAGDFYLFLPNTPHRFVAKDETPVCMLAFSFGCNASILELAEGKTSLNEYQQELVYRILSETKKVYKTPFNKQLSPLDNPTFGAQQLMETYAECLLVNVVRKKLEENPDVSVNSDSAIAEKHCVNEIIELLRLGVYQSLSLSDVQKNMYYSKTYLNSIFKKSTGMSIMSYYRYLKIEEAKRLICAGEKIVDVSNKLHFDSPNYFHKVFKDLTGLTPTEYKKANLHKYPLS